ncbi:MAG TPA: ABC transporter permease [Gammaproteobacteria bacterium]|nr:ABC transporter permease [Gammaproteobacteria bacterium]
MEVERRTSFKVQRDVLYALLLREMGSRFGRTRASFLWVLVEPLAHLLVPMTIFGYVMQRSLPGVEYPVFLFYGFLPFLFFKTICLQTMEGTRANRGLLSYRQVLLMDVFIAKALSFCAIEAIVFLIVLVGLQMLAYDALPGRPLELLAVLALTVMFAFGMGLLLAAVGSFAPDAKNIVRVIFIPLYFLSGVLFPVTRFPDDWVQYLAINPVLHVVEMARVNAIAHYEPMRYLSAEYVIGLTIFSLFIGLALYRLRYLQRVTM